MDFERYYQVKIPSNKIHNNKQFSTLTSKNNSNFSPLTLDPWYITGLIDGEGSIMVRVRQILNIKQVGLFHRFFSISLHKAELPLLKAVKAYF